MDSLSFQLELAKNLGGVVNAKSGIEVDHVFNDVLKSIDNRFNLDCGFLLLKDQQRKETFRVSRSTSCKLTPFLEGKFPSNSPTFTEICADLTDWQPLKRDRFPDDRLWELLWQTVELGPYPSGWKISGRLLGADFVDPVNSPGAIIMIAPHNAPDWDDLRRQELKLAAAQIWHVVERADADAKMRATVSEFVRRVTAAGENILLHSIFSPLQRLELHAELARRAQKFGKSSDLVRHIEAMQSNAWEASRFAKGILDLGKPSGDRPPPDQLNALQVLDGMLNDFRPFANVKQKDIVLRADSHDVIPMARADLEEIFSNLIHNAIKYGHPYTKIKVNVHSNRADVKLDVTSYGIPIPSDAYERVFDLGFRTPEAARLEFNAVGFGLHRARELANRWGQLYVATSEPDATYPNSYRTVFRLRVPKT